VTPIQIFVRSSLTLALPFVLVWAYFGEILHGIRSGFHDAWLQVRIEFASYREQMKREDY
jgi:hypothetical protein